jgi:3',5'-nucleoside bisphosphate phosphatase
MGKADLHIHSSASDGRHSPAEIVHMAVNAGLTVMALTDHDTIDGLIPALEAAREFPALTLIPGVELSTDTSSGEVHVLGYFIDYNNKEFKASLERMRNSRAVRASKMVAKLKELGCNIELALLEKGYITSFKEAFSKYIGHECPAYVGREKLTHIEAVQLVLKAHGLPVLAHPFTTLNLETIVKELKTVGLTGMEVYYAGYLPAEIKNLLNMAQKYNLIPTGGTDYHGIDADAEITIGGTDVPFNFVEQLIAQAEKEF